MKYQGIIFDFNGVLLWDDELHKKAFVEVALKLRGKVLSDEEFEMQVMGRPNKAILNYLAGKELEDEEILALALEKESAYQKLCLEYPAHFKLSPGAVNLFDFLVRKNIPHTIASGSDKNNMDFFAQHLNLAQWFNVEKIVYDNHLRPGKPFPDIYLEAAKNIGILPEKCIVVEDSIAGLEAAHRASIGRIIALGPEKRHKFLLKLPCVCQVIESLQEFPLSLFP